MRRGKPLGKWLIFCFILGLFMGWFIRAGMLEGFGNEINVLFSADEVFKNLIFYELFYGLLFLIAGLLIYCILYIIPSPSKNNTRQFISRLFAILTFFIIGIPIFSFLRCVFLKDIPLFFTGAPLWREEIGFMELLSGFGVFYVTFLIFIWIVLAILAAFIIGKLAFLAIRNIDSDKVGRLFIIFIAMLLLLDVIASIREHFMIKEEYISEADLKVPTFKRQNTENKVYLICLDGATWDVINPMINEDKLPNLKRLLKDSAYSNLTTVYPPYTGAVTPAVLTGKLPHRTGFGKNLGVYNTNRISYHIFSRMNKKYRFHINWITNLTLRIYSLPIKILTKVFASSEEGKSLLDIKANVISSKTIKDIISLNEGVKAGFVHMPVIYEERVFLIGYSAADDEHIDRKVEKIISEVRARRTLPNQIEDFNLSSSGKMRKVVLEDFREDIIDSKLFDAVSEMDPDFLFVWMTLTDSFGHYFGCLARDDNVLIRKDLREKCKKAYELSYIEEDHFLGRVLDKRDENTTIIVISDHGFNQDATSHIYSYTEGIFIINGKFSKKGLRMDGASILDITPTVLALLGYPVAEDMDGRVLEESIEDGFWNEYPPKIIRTYGKRTSLGIQELTEQEKKKKLEKFKALGYI